MLKSALLFAFLIVTHMLSAQIHPSKIDTILTDQEIEKVINSFFPGNEYFKLQKINTIQNKYGDTSFCRRIADSLGITESFYKADLDKNGYTDLLAIGGFNNFNIFVVMNYGGDSLALTRLTRDHFQECSFPKIIRDTVIRYYNMHYPGRRETGQPVFQQRDLVFKFGEWVELNPTPRTYQVEKIELEITPCYGRCPVFSISIDKDRTAIFKAERNNKQTNDSKEIKGTFKTTIQQHSYATIISLLNYIDFTRLKDQYAVNWTDDQTAILKITYNNGQVKQINDYGMMGTYGLDRLYQLISDLRFNQDWK